MVHTANARHPVKQAGGHATSQHCGKDYIGIRRYLGRPLRDGDAPFLRRRGGAAHAWHLSMIFPARACRGSTWFAAPNSTRSEEHTSELQSLMRISYAVFCLKKKNTSNTS